jgi:phycocyanobilin lyase beta subunit
MTEARSITEWIHAVHGATSPEELLRATQALAASDPEDDRPELIDCLVEVLGFNNPGAAVAAVEGLIRRGPRAVPPLLDRLDPRNYGARAWAVRALAGIGDVRGLDVLEEALATDVGPSVRRAAACGLGSLRLRPLAPESRVLVRERALQALEAGSQDDEWVVRYAVTVGLESLGRGASTDPFPHERAWQSLSRLGEEVTETILVVRLRARQALRRLNEELSAPVPGPGGSWHAADNSSASTAEEGA